MIGQTFARCASCGPAERIYVSAGSEHRVLGLAEKALGVEDQLLAGLEVALDARLAEDSRELRIT